jgi:flavodoxin
MSDQVAPTGRRVPDVEGDSMRSVVVYESMYGNTEAIARAIAAGLAAYGQAEAVVVDDADRAAIDEVDLLVVGTPTHAWGLPRERTWESDGAGARRGRLVRDWLTGVSDGRGRPAAAFATRLDKSRILTGSAAGGIARRLRRRGWATTQTPASFRVTGGEGPLRVGEVDRARAWGEQLGSAVDPTTPRG